MRVITLTLRIPRMCTRRVRIGRVWVVACRVVGLRRLVRGWVMGLWLVRRLIMFVMRLIVLRWRLRGCVVVVTLLSRLWVVKRLGVRRVGGLIV